MKFFVIGLGSIGARHAKNLLDMGHTVWGYDKSVEAALRVKEQLPGLEIAADFFDCDAYVICTPPDQHIAEMINAVEAGKHIFVEKPIGIPEDIEPLGRMLEDAKHKNLVVMVGNNLRFNAAVKECKYIIESQRHGSPMWASFVVAQFNSKYQDPTLLNWGAHEIDLALYLLGPATVKACVGDFSNCVDIILEHGHFHSHVHMDYLAHPEIRAGTIIGTDGNHHYRISVPDDDYVDEMKEFIYRICNNHGVYAHGAPPKVGATGDDGLATLKIIADAMRMANAS